MDEMTEKQEQATRIIEAIGTTTLNECYRPVINIVCRMCNSEDSMRSLPIFQIINKGKFDCSLLDNYRFDYLVENNLTETPACAKLERIQKNIRIWRLTP